jgi:hypothetical protein
MRIVRRMIAAALLIAVVALFSPAAQACVNCPCLRLSKNGPCLLR